MFSNDLSMISRVEVALNALDLTSQQLSEHGYTSAQVMVALAR